ncbi:hypothetical protein ACFV4Q_02625 [Streptomyces nojiriensis]
MNASSLPAYEFPASWVLHYTDDPEAAAGEMLRVLGHGVPHVRILTAQRP